MADSTFQATDFIGDFIANPNYTDRLMGYADLPPELELSDYILPEVGSEEDSTATHIGSYSQNPILPENFNENSIGYEGSTTPRTSNIKCKNGVKKAKVDVEFRIAFRTKSELEIMDDGFKWRKYGKKSVKNSPNPRNYYRCASGECHVKKRVERDPEDPSYVITTYVGVHNHESPCVVYYNQMPLMVPSGWTLQASHSSS